MRKLNIGYFADGPWSHRTFERLIADETIQVAFIVPRIDSTDETLLRYSQDHGIPCHKGAKINSDEFYALAQGYACDLFVSMSFNQIFKPRITQLPPLGTINCHAGRLPFYRGRNILNWALINDEKEFGITVHYVDEGIDTGDIILQRTYPITEADDYGTLLQLAHVECANILYDAIKELQAGRSSRIVQNTIHPIGFYCGMRGPGDEVIHWGRSSREVFNFIRAVCSPGPMGRTTLGGRPVTVNRARLIEGAPIYKGTAGQVVGISDTGYIVKTLDSTIEVQDVTSEVKIRIGDRLGS